MIRLAVTDMDGTFLHTGGGYDRQLAREVLAEVQAAGIQLVACTGKQCERVEDLFEGVAADPWIIGDSAARITHGGRLMWQHPLGAELGQQVAQDLHRIDPELVVIVCVGDTAHVLDRTPEDLVDFVRMSYRTVVQVESFEEVTGEIVKVTAFDLSGRTARARALLRQTYGEAVHVIDSDPQWLDVTAAGVDKGTSLAVLQQYLDIGPEQTLAFGDGRNDLPLFDRAAFSMCVANGLEEVKEAAAFVIGANDEDAVLHVLRRFARAQSTDPSPTHGASGPLGTEPQESA